MENLTQSQKSIVNTLVAEFTNLNEHHSISGNIFMPLYDEAMKDEIRIKEINAIHIANTEAIFLQIQNDIDKYWDMFYEVGVVMSERYDENKRYWKLTAIDRSVYNRSSSGQNKLIWDYEIDKKEEYILGEWRKYNHSLFISFNGKKYKNIEEMFESEQFKTWLKELISIARNSQ